ncbi:hypothetical protein [Flavobacterium pedocola]
MKLTILLFASFICSTFVNNDTHTVKIKDVRKTKNWQQNLKTCYVKDKTVEVYRIDANGSAYMAVIYNNKNNEVSCDKNFVYGTDQDYEFAEYRWVDDSIVNVSLFNKSNRNVEEFHINNQSKVIAKGIYKQQLLSVR